MRSTDDLGGLTLMGLRLYDPTTGRFASADPIPGGNANTYTYPSDPINGYDLSGQFSCGWCHRHSGLIHKAVGVGVSIGVGIGAAGLCSTGIGCVAVVGALGGAAANLGAQNATSKYVTHDHPTNKQQVKWAVGGAVGGGAISGVRNLTGTGTYALASGVAKHGIKKAVSGAVASAIIHGHRFL